MQNLYLEQHIYYNGKDVIKCQKKLQINTADYLADNSFNFISSDLNLRKILKLDKIVEIKMNSLVHILVTIVVCANITHAAVVSRNYPVLQYTINKTWDNRTVDDNSNVKLTFQVVDNYFPDKQGLLIYVDAPFYNDPNISESIPTNKPTLGLWNYEVVEAFFLGDNEEYLEIELGPKGHYILLLLKGKANLVTYELPLTNFTTSISNNRWMGVAYIPGDYFPCNISRFNAYAIHGSDPERVYMSLYPVPTNEFTYPDFHRLETFQTIKLGTSEINHTDKCMKSVN